MTTKKKKSPTTKSTKAKSGPIPRVLTDDEVTIMCELLELGGTITEACKRIGISRNSFYLIQKRDLILNNRIQVARSKFFDNIRMALTRLCNSNNPAVVIHMSKAYLGNVEKKALDATISVSNLSDEELKKKALEILNRESEDEAEV